MRFFAGCRSFPTFARLVGNTAGLTSEEELEPTDDVSSHGWEAVTPPHSSSDSIVVAASAKARRADMILLLAAAAF